MGLRGLKADGGMWHRLNPGEPKFSSPASCQFYRVQFYPLPPKKKKKHGKKNQMLRTFQKVTSEFNPWIDSTSLTMPFLGWTDNIKGEL